MKTLFLFLICLGLSGCTISCQSRPVDHYPIENSPGQGQMVYKADWLDGVYCLCFNDKKYVQHCYYFVIPVRGGPTQVMGNDGLPLQCYLQDRKED